MKKKRFFRGREWPGWMKKLLVMMKLTAFLLFLSVMAMATGSYSQNTRFDLNVKNASIVQVLEEIERQTEYGFLFKTNQLDLNERYTLDLKSAKIETVMGKILNKDLYSYRIMDRIIVISKKGLDASLAGDQNSGKVLGKVTDSSGSPLPGVTVVVKGTTQGTVTNADGEYSLSDLPENATLQFSFVGMKTQEVKVGSQTNINMVMEVDAIGLDEIVAVGYGTQRKADLTGSVSAISEKEMEKLNVTQTSQLLTGLASGVTVTQSSGQPGRDNVNVTIRGLGTFSGAGNNPLVLVDGLSSSLDNVNINDIESISILKDAASASIYGTRGANGVILVTTKKGKQGEFKISYQGNVGIQRPTETVQIADSWVYAEMYNEALVNSGVSPQFSTDEIEKFKSLW